MTTTPPELLTRVGRRLRVGLVGGGLDSVIGETHQMALRVDGLFELVAGAMSIDPDVARASARAALIDESRSYRDYREMAQAEAERDDGIDLVVIATPPRTHFEIASTFLAGGINVLCEKPLARTVAEARRLVDAVQRSGLVFALNHCFTGYPVVRHARDAVAAGVIGRVTMVEMDFPSGDVDLAREPADPARRHWRFRPESMGRAGILGELGTHAHHLAEYVTGDRVTTVAATMHTFAAGREVYDNAYLTLGLSGGAVGRIWTSYVAIGNEHGLAFRIYGDEGGLLWRQEDPERLWLQRAGQAPTLLTKGGAGQSAAALGSSRFRPGHPEGYLLAFANIYRDLGLSLLAALAGDDPAPYRRSLPGVRDGLATLHLYEAAERSHDAGGTVEVVGQE
ncbi:Gfo/Idh/MocA family protein [Dactylosporangium sucinum]|uniref:Gfo/Idh/MocA family protein n=1 Tax=Dactylosporangium sucinum TaxID=1424081 RepID=UPI00167E03D2|nr:Gfo/Idh/MocA family oxidoreductase [Dactylosporangium sucinum]